VLQFGVRAGKGFKAENQVGLREQRGVKQNASNRKGADPRIRGDRVAGTGVATGVVHIPLQQAIDIHKNHLDQNSTMPEQSRQGQQNALDHLMENQQRWLSKPRNETADVNDTDFEQPEID